MANCCNHEESARALWIQTLEVYRSDKSITRKELDINELDSTDLFKEYEKLEPEYTKKLDGDLKANMVHVCHYLKTRFVNKIGNGITVFLTSKSLGEVDITYFNIYRHQKIFAQWFVFKNGSHILKGEGMLSCLSDDVYRLFGQLGEWIEEKQNTAGGLNAILDLFSLLKVGKELEKGLNDIKKSWKYEQTREVPNSDEKKPVEEDLKKSQIIITDSKEEDEHC